MNESLTKQVIKTIAETLGIEPAEISLADDLYLDLNASPQEINLIVEQLQEIFDATLPDLNSEESITVGQLAELVYDSTL
jgi:acyl carrier protein